MPPQSSIAPQIRTARREELPVVSALVASVFSGFRGKAPSHVLDRYIPETADIASQSADGEVCVVEAGGGIAGCVIYYEDGQLLDFPQGWAGLRTLAIDPLTRGRGLGRRLIEHCIRRASDDGRHTLGLHTAGFMQHALGIYRELGFERAPEFDHKASDLLGFDPTEGDVDVIAYRLRL